MFALDYGMTPDEYRAKWGLKPDYPMVAPAYARKRQAVARKIGLGRKPPPVGLLQARGGATCRDEQASRKGAPP